MRIAKNHPGLQKLDAVVVPMDSELIGSSWKLFSLLAAGVTLLLLIACVNVANLLLARLMDREKESSLRSALVAPRSRLILQLFTESLIFSRGFGWSRISFRGYQRPAEPAAAVRDSAEA